MTKSSGPAARAFWTIGAGRGEIRDVDLPAPGPDEVLVRTLWSGVSRGTEALVFAGRVPEGERTRMRAPFQEGDFPFPVKYGYAAVGVVEAGPGDLAGRSIFCLHPHQTRFVVPAAAVRPLPEGLPPARAVLAANAETALNALWDGGAGPGDRIAVVGGGAVGALVGAFAGAIPGTEVTLVDVDPAKAGLADRLGIGFAAPGSAACGADLVFHASATAAGLETALRLAGDEATVVELSWYGDRPVTVGLGGHFHAGRLRIVSSQVGRVAPDRRPRWDYARRLGKALELLRDDRLDALLSEAIDFDTLPDRMSGLLSGPGGACCPLIRYPSEP
ncbi:zinc-dependent alcohol dehydrogenase [Prosthecomicrobium sp. N25]|uniref:zinc-dependent alcohol dehydrogenase n=1 Tax=Prosthecomicrobium sp. N25 TaxID=3129254 RepID=UPI003077634F